MKGQTSVETLFLLLVIITSTIFIMGQYTQTHDATVGISIVRTEVNSIANSMDKMVLIKKVDLNRRMSGENIFNIKTDPATLTKLDFNQNGELDEITTRIIQSTQLTNIQYRIN
jgi:hypothetical protein